MLDSLDNTQYFARSVDGPSLTTRLFLGAEPQESPHISRPLPSEVEDNQIPPSPVTELQRDECTSSKLRLFSVIPEEE